METGLLAACKAGDEAAWERLFASRAGQVYRWAVLLGLRPADAEDAAQEVFATAARRIASCRSEQALGSWLFQITRRVVANARRAAWWRRLVPMEEPPEPAFEHASPDRAEDEQLTRACLSRIPPAQAEVLVLLEVEGFTREEAAEALGIPPGTVASRLRLAREAFRTEWERRTGVPGEAWLTWEGEP